jgi:hypothetical protein
VDARQSFGRKIFIEVLMVACWAIRKHRNEVIFNGVSVSLQRWKSVFKEGFKLVLLRAKPS